MSKISETNRRPYLPDIFEELGELAQENDPDYKEASKAIRELSVLEQKRINSTDFLNRLYNESLRRLLEDQGCKIVVEFGPQEIPHWQIGQDTPGTSFDSDVSLQKGIIVEDQHKTYALTLGERRWGSYEKKSGLSFQFGVISNKESSIEETLDIEDLKTIVGTTWDSRGKGEFHIESMWGEVNIRCGADSGGMDKKTLREWRQADLLSDKGFLASLALVERNFTEIPSSS